ncbi:RND transporter [Pseudomonas sp. SWI6]|uniref:Efflux transporter outer membrane subunit n=1 Tax=Pseudomonas taiwanensis TaxID=470150 RepID=A0ABR6V7H3_9PSED|nr:MULTISPECIES: efflux transporter outer membrane subunit [Pseudomonas]AVD81594.1 RND transporter [Pseudomonas sp. SWI6]MBC3476494.1 efflux transporter outer membrane subunit [Pseudomonas taiwanensis]MBC3490763.1 efflux transporter outer membrane subunit [Pseudomonas taiwanensis]MDT8922726.1 efflux transporter outer membrane subunit [Pseudomonas taiwanensis]MPT01323.1 efflux transporter outer membrane subunit [Pseudomonas sp.]
MPKRCHGLILLLVLTGCSQVGPDFAAPQDRWLQGWSTPLLEQAGRTAPTPDLSRWWAVFADPTLDALIAEADAQNTNLRVAGLRIVEARAQLAIVQTGRYPQLQQLRAQSLYLKQDQSGTPTARDSVFWQSSLGFDIAWEVDFWGRFSRAIESADAAYFASQANYADAMVLLRAQVADTYFGLRTAEARLAIAQENARRQARSLEITERLFRHGENDELDWQQARTQYLATQATIPEFQNQVNALRNVLCSLIGRPPGPLPELEARHGQLPLPDRAVLQDVPANLLQRRPDIRAAEQAVAAQSALVGVAEADLYPSLSLLGSIGWSFVTANHVPDTFDLAAGPSLIWNPFDYGRRKNAVRVEDARLQQLIERYHQNVRDAAREADDAASGLVRSLESAGIRQQASQAAQRSLSLASSQYREGFADFQRVLDAQQLLLQQQDGYLVSRGNAVSSLVSLYKALGGGWEQVGEPIPPATRQQMQQRTDWGTLLDGPAPEHQETGTRR